MRKNFLIIFLVAFFALAGLLSAPSHVLAGTANVWGWAWSENIGWISMNATNAMPGYSLINEAVHDDDNTYIYTNSTSPVEGVYNIDDPGLPLPATTITSVKVKAYYQNPGSVTLGFFLGGTFGKLTAVTGAGWTWDVKDFTSARSWAWSDIKNTQLLIGMQRTAGNPSPKVTQIQLEVTDSAGMTRIYRPNAPGNYDTIEGRSSSNSKYKVTIDDTTGLFSGYAWSENIGWISFNQADLAGCPSAPCEARIALTGANAGQVSGWARPIMPQKYEYYDYYNPVGAGGMQVNDSIGSAQTFTVGAIGPNENFNLASVKIKVYKDGSPGTVYASIKNVDGGGHPAGPDLCSGSVNGNNFTTGPSYQWQEISLSGCSLTTGSKYALVVRVPGGDATNDIFWENDGGLYDNCSGTSPAPTPTPSTTPSPTPSPSVTPTPVPGTCGSFPTPNFISYAGGDKETWNSFTSSWTSDLVTDFKFEIFGISSNNWIKLNPNAAAGSNKIHLVGNEFQGWAFGGANSNDEAVIGWISFNHITSNPTGTGANIDYKVLTDLVVNPISPPNPPSSLSQTWSCNFSSLQQIIANSGQNLTLNWTYNSGSSGLPQAGYEVQICSNVSCSGSKFDYTATNSASTSYTFNPSDCPACITFSPGGTYYWRVQTMNTGSNNWSGYPSAAQFSTPAHAYPDPNFTNTPLQPAKLQPTNFDSSSTAFATGSANKSWSWTFQNGTPATSALQNPTGVKFSNSSNAVQLTVSDDAVINSGSNACSIQKSVIVNMPLPVWKEIAPF